MDEVLTERRGGVLVMTMNRPAARNAIDTPMAQALLAGLDELDQDASLRAGVLTGGGGTFCAGIDLKAFATSGPPDGFGTFVRRGSTKPLVAGVEGHALAGGLELALTCDVIVAATGSKFGFPEVKVGLFAAAGGLNRLPRHLPFGVAAELALTGDAFTAEVALQHGLVTRVVPDGGACDEAVRVATKIAGNAPLAVAATKDLLRAAYGRTEDDFWTIQDERRPHVFDAPDALEGARAFAERRAPRWTGRVER